jgi:chemotaxis protein histidine kinase CheA
MEAHADEVGTAVCEFVPLVDVLCDVIGGASAVGMEVTAAAEAAKSAADYATAAASRATGDSELALAAELQAAADLDEGAAAELAARAAALEAEAADEQAVATQEEAAADEKLEQAAVEQEAATAEEEKAAAEQAASSEALEESLVHGLAAAWNAIAAILLSALLIPVFAWRILTSFCLPSARGAAIDPVLRIAIPIQQFALHFGILLMGLGCFGLLGLVSSWSELGLRARGGIILLFAACAAVLEGLLQIVSPQCLNSAEASFWPAVKRLGFGFVKSVTILTVLFVLEVLILLVALGEVHVAALVNVLQSHWYLGIITVLALVMHYNVVARKAKAKEKNDSTETKALLAGENVEYGSTEGIVAAPSLLQDYVSDSGWNGSTQRLQFTFEMLLIVGLVSLLCNCTPNFLRLWPLFRSRVHAPVHALFVFGSVGATLLKIAGYEYGKCDVE